MQAVYRMITRVLRNDLTVLVLGESGTGKELVAEAIHQLGHRRTVRSWRSTLPRFRPS
jgi:two-component system nitrogen regulation response regulator GlnG